MTVVIFYTSQHMVNICGGGYCIGQTIKNAYHLK